MFTAAKQQEWVAESECIKILLLEWNFPSSFPTGRTDLLLSVVASERRLGDWGDSGWRVWCLSLLWHMHSGAPLSHRDFKHLLSTHHTGTRFGDVQKQVIPVHRHLTLSALIYFKPDPLKCYNFLSTKTEIDALSKGFALQIFST